MPELHEYYPGFCKTPANNLYTSSSLFYIIRSLTLLSLHIQSFRRVALKNVTQQNEDAATAQTEFLFNVTVRDGLSCTPFQVLSRILFSLSLNLYVHVCAYMDTKLIFACRK